MAAKVDRRVRKTKAQLREGLAHLMLEKSIKEITVKELVDKVDINRSTFYLHYSDIYQMLQKIEEEALENITCMLITYLYLLYIPNHLHLQQNSFLFWTVTRICAGHSLVPMETWRLWSRLRIFWLLPF